MEYGRRSQGLNCSRLLTFFYSFFCSFRSFNINMLHFILSHYNPLVRLLKTQPLLLLLGLNWRCDVCFCLSENFFSFFFLFDSFIPLLLLLLFLSSHTCSPISILQCSIARGKVLKFFDGLMMTKRTKVKGVSFSTAHLSRREASVCVFVVRASVNNKDDRLSLSLFVVDTSINSSWRIKIFSLSKS